MAFHEFTRVWIAFHDTSVLRAATVLLVLSAAAGNAAAQHIAAPTTVRVRGDGRETWVLLSGVVGGVAGMQKLETRLVERGYRVVTIDSYALSLDSTIVSFAALARRVDAQLALLDVQHAHIVGHAHGGGVALRLAASYPERVASIGLLDVGALPLNRTTVLGRAIALIPLLAKMPGGRAFLRSRFDDGIRENSGNDAWFDASARHAYVDAVVNDIGRVVAMAQRLSRSQEPEPLSNVLARIHVPVVVVVGETPHPAAPGSAELDALNPLGSLVRIVRLANVGHFPHEEAPDQVLAAFSPTFALVRAASVRQ